MPGAPQKVQRLYPTGLYSSPVVHDASGVRRAHGHYDRMARSLQKQFACMASERSREQILREIEQHHQAIARLEEEAAQSPPVTAAWPPAGFYATYYLVAGLMLGTVGALNSFLFNVIGSFFVHQDPMYILRVFGTFFLGQEALTTDDLTFLMLVLLTHLSIGAAAGALFHMGLNLWWPNLRSFQLLVVAAGFGSSCGWLASMGSYPGFNPIWSERHTCSH